LKELLLIIAIIFIISVTVMVKKPKSLFTKVIGASGTCLSIIAFFTMFFSQPDSSSVPPVHSSEPTETSSSTDIYTPDPRWDDPKLDIWNSVSKKIQESK
jgi:hypothetical protein